MREYYYCAQRNFTYRFLRGSENKNMFAWINTIKGAVDRSKWKLSIVPIKHEKTEIPTATISIELKVRQIRYPVAPGVINIANTSTIPTAFNEETIDIDNSIRSA